MKKIAGRTALAALASATVAASVIGLTSTSASAIENTPCISDTYLKVEFHDFFGNHVSCFHHAGEQGGFVANSWVTAIWTGDNRVQWYGDGRWQPDGGINPNTTFTWPNHPGGVRIEKVRIL